MTLFYCHIMHIANNNNNNDDDDDDDDDNVTIMLSFKE